MIICIDDNYSARPKQVFDKELEWNNCYYITDYGNNCDLIYVQQRQKSLQQIKIMMTPFLDLQTEHRWPLSTHRQPPTKTSSYFVTYNYDISISMTSL